MSNDNFFAFNAKLYDQIDWGKQSVDTNIKETTMPYKAEHKKNGRSGNVIGTDIYLNNVKWTPIIWKDYHTPVFCKTEDLNIYKEK